MNTFRLLLLAVLAVALPVVARGASSLPAYYLSVQAEHLQKLDANPWTNEYVPAMFAVDGKEYPCDVRYRGVSTRDAPKKSWRIKFKNRDNPFGVEKINLTAQYYDQSLLRHYTVTRFFERLGHPAPAVRHINLYLNGDYAGVFVDVENVDTDFFARRSLHPSVLFKGDGHGSRFVPLMSDDAYSTTWDREIGGIGAHRELMQIMSSLMHLPDSRLVAYMEQHFDVPQVLTYFAVEYAVAAHDNITKNYFLYHDADSDRYRLISWDNDAVLGNDYRGEFDSSGYRLSYNGSLFRTNHLLQRMYDIPAYRSQIIQIVQDVAGRFDELAALADSAAVLIREDVYRDPAKCCSNEDFERSLHELYYFLAKRRDYLQQLPDIHVSPQSLSCSHAFARPGDTVTFSIDATGASSRFFSAQLIFDLDFGKPGDSTGTVPLDLHDDGLHNDGAAGDNLYANSIVLPEQKQAVIPYVFASSQRYYPAGGINYIEHVPSWTPAIVLTEAEESDYAQVQLTEVVQVEGEYALVFVNTSERDLDLSYSAVRGNEHHLRWPFPPGTVVAPQQKLVVAGSVALARQILAPATVVGSLFFSIKAGDTLALLGPDGRTLAVYPVHTIRQEELKVRPLIINEIRYSSGSSWDKDGGDWVELYNPGTTAVETEGWVLQDIQDDNFFIFPVGSSVPAQGYALVCTDTSAFDATYPSVSNRIGNMDFAFGNSDAVRLFDAAGRLVDVVEYSDDAPWPEAPDAEEPTLELVNPVQDNALPMHWQVSEYRGGTPGRINSVADPDPSTAQIVINEINYRAPESLDAGDWVELYNPTEKNVDLGNWMLTDEESDHIFRFPVGASIAAKGYFVVVRKPEDFRSVHPHVHTAYSAGPLGFGFSGDGGEIRLFNRAGELIDSVRYGVDAPWPVLPEGGATIALVDPAADNTLPGSWQLSQSPAGTPAAPNSAIEPGGGIEIARVEIGPNPAQNTLAVELALTEAGTMTVELFDAQGRQCSPTLSSPVPSAYYSLMLDISTLPSGQYFLRFQHNDTVLAVETIVKVQ